MDEFGTFRLNRLDAQKIKESLLDQGTIIFPFSYDKIGCMIIMLCVNPCILGTMPFGGNPRGRVYVGIYGRGCGHFSQGQTHWNYFEEKLGLAEPDAMGFANFWELMWSSE